MVKDVRYFAIFFLACSLILPGSVWASEEELIKKMAILEDRVKALEKKVGEQEACIQDQSKCISEQTKSLEDYRRQVEQLGISPSLVRPERRGINIAGFKVGAGLTTIGQYALDANNGIGQRATDVFDGTLSADIGITREISDFGKAFLHLEYGQPGAPGVENEINVYPFTNVNRDASTSGFVISEAWYEHRFYDNKLALMVGKFDSTIYFDNNSIANDETTQFLNRMFRNNPAIEFPDDNAIGVRLSVAPFEMIELSAAIADANAKWERIADNLFSIVQMNLRPNLLGKSGNYRFILWNNEKYHTKLLDAEATKKNNAGYALCFDQMITDDFALFMRFGQQDQRVSIVEYSWSTGFQVLGTFWKRPDDALGCAIGQAIAGHDYKEANPGYSAKPQTTLEVYYNFKVNDYLALSPGYQIIWNPNGTDPDGIDGPISIIGIRGQVDF